MDNSVEITFKCSQNTATLMMAFYAIITNENPDDSIIGPDYFGWIIDELGQKSIEYADYITHASNDNISSGFKDLIRSYTSRRNSA